MGQLNLFDYGVIFVYFCILVGLGLYLKKRATASIEDYFIGGRTLPWWALGISGMASFLDIAGTMLIVSFLYIIGPRGLFIEFRGGAVLVLICMLLWTGKWHRRSQCITGAEWQIYRFGNGFGGQFARVVSAMGAIVGTVGMLAYMVKAVGLFLSMFINLSPLQCSLIMITIAMVYTMASGFYGVVFTDIFQSGIILIAVIAISIMAIIKIGQVQAVTGFASFGELAENVTGSTQWMSSKLQRVTEMPKGYEAYKHLALLAFFYIMRNMVGGMGAGAEPKYFGARSDRECGTLTFLWTWLMMFRWPMMMAFAVLGVFLIKEQVPDQTIMSNSEVVIKQYLHEEKYPGQALEIDKLDELSKVAPTETWEEINEHINPVETEQKEQSKFMSFFATESNVTEETLGKLQAHLGDDWEAKFTTLYQQQKRLDDVIPKRKWEETIYQIDSDHPLAGQMKVELGDDWVKKIKLLSYEGTVNPERILPAVILYNIPAGFRGLILIALIAASMSTFDSTVNMTTGFFTRDIYQGFLRSKASSKELIYASWAFIFGIVVFGFVMGYQVESVNAIWSWIIMGLGGGFIMPNVLRLYWWRFNGGGFAFGTIGGGMAAILDDQIWKILSVVCSKFGDIGELNDWKLFIMTVSVSLLSCIIGTYLTRPTDKKVLENFYKTTRPFGIWGHMKPILEPSVRKAMEKEHLNDIIALPFTLCWQVTLFLIPMQLIIRDFKSAGYTSIVFVISLIGMYVFWYRNLPAENFPGEDNVPVPAVSAEADSNA